MHKFDVFINFNGNCREAVEFYAKVFKKEPGQIMTYGDAPYEGGNPADKDRILYADLPIYGSNMMLSDSPSQMEFVRGNSIGMSIGDTDADELRRLFDELSVGGEVQMPPQKTFWSELYSMVTDKYGILWHLSLISEDVK
ncbi:MAG: VOC family protein [Nitrososphaerota archaeon]|nr:VOC family protein [Candidatus Termitimicrobium sp.]MCL2432140.1 VOC family protein [Candidatus Termitimicrobium sp.]MDR0492290.1 VOC family protein [Nitrososphaerota archaeon]